MVLFIIFINIFINKLPPDEQLGDTVVVFFFILSCSVLSYMGITLILVVIEHCASYVRLFLSDISYPQTQKRCSYTKYLTPT